MAAQAAHFDRSVVYHPEKKFADFVWRLQHLAIRLRRDQKVNALILLALSERGYRSEKLAGLCGRPEDTFDLSDHMTWEASR